jgi:hypothetical protein
LRPTVVLWRMIKIHGTVHESGKWKKPGKNTNVECEILCLLVYGIYDDSFSLHCSRANINFYFYTPAYVAVFFILETNRFEDDYYCVLSVD